MNSVLKCTLTLAVFLIFTLPALGIAAPPPEVAKALAACKEEKEKYCKTQSAEAAITCLNDNHAKISVECRSSVFAAEFTVECAKDVSTHCSKVKPGDGRILKCLNDNLKTLGGRCKRNVPYMHARSLCSSDTEKFCGKVKPGEGRLAKCMKENEAKLSTECRTVGKAIQLF